MALYDTIGRRYSDYRRPDPRIARAIHAALGDVRTVLNIGAGAGSYEPADRSGVAVEISETMIRQRPLSSAPVVCASAMDLPFSDDGFDCAMALLTIHHWLDQARGLGEMMRVAKRSVVFTWDHAVNLAESWLARDYFHEFADYFRNNAPPIESLAAM